MFQRPLLLLCWTSLLAVSTSAFSVGLTARSSVSVQPEVGFATICPLQQRRQKSKQALSSKRLHASALGAAATKDDGPLSGNKIDRTLSKLTSGFPLWVVGAALLALLKPATLAWVSKGQIIEIMLAFVMIGMGMTLEKKDFTAVFADNNWSAVPFGVLCQFGIMPIAAGLVGRAFLLPIDASLYLGLVLVGCSPGGTASNLVSLIAGANVALSVLLTACSTFLAAAMTPLLVKFLVGGTTIAVSGKALCLATAKVVLGPVLIGMGLNAKLPALSKAASRFTPFASVLLVAVICGGVMASNASAVFGLVGGQFLPRILGAVVTLHSIGFACGYFLPKTFKYRESTARTISIETGMQNSALAVVLAQSIGAPPLAALPGAISALTHSCLGSMLAAYWRVRDRKEGSSGDYGVDDQGFIYQM
jgi:BASS family bile acid:Na+ symporter